MESELFSTHSEHWVSGMTKKLLSLCCCAESLLFNWHRLDIGSFPSYGCKCTQAYLPCGGIFWYGTEAERCVPLAPEGRFS